MRAKDAQFMKICGLKNHEVIDTINTAKPSMVGFVFYPRSPRHLDQLTAASLATRIAPDIARVAVLVDANNDEIDAACAAVSPHHLQLHGSETPERLCEIKTRTGLSIIKSFGIEAETDFALTSIYEDCVDLFLFEPKISAGNTLPGGRGATMDWKLLRTYRGTTPWMLAGGLTAENVARAMRISGAQQVDVSSGVESTPGVKDAQKIVAFISAFIIARAARTNAA